MEECSDTPLGLADQRQSGGGWRHHSRHTRRVVLPREAEGALVVEAHAVLAQGIVEIISLLVVPLKLLAAQLVQQTLLSVGGGGRRREVTGEGLAGEVRREWCVARSSRR